MPFDPISFSLATRAERIAAREADFLGARAAAVEGGGSITTLLGSRLVLRLLAHEGVTVVSGATPADGDRVTAWSDTRTGGRVASPLADTTTRPTYIRNCYNAMPALRFSGAQVLEIPHSADLNPEAGEFRIFLVMRSNWFGIANLLTKGNNTSTATGYSLFTAAPVDGVQLAVRAKAAADAAGASQAYTNLSYDVHIAELAFSGTALTGVLNGSTTGWVSGGGGPTVNTYANTIAPTNTLRIGGGIGTPAASPGRLDVFALLVVKGAMTATEVGIVRDYLRALYPAGPIPSVRYTSSGNVFFPISGRPIHRIPAVVQCNDGSILCFAESRESTSDAGEIDCVVRRAPSPDEAFGPEVTLTAIAGETWGNPSAIVNRATGRVHLLNTWNLGEDTEAEIFAGTSTDTRRVYHRYSDDNGVTWTAPVDITAAVKPSTWRWYATGPGSFEQLADGRLMISCNHSDPAYEVEDATWPIKCHVIICEDDLNWTLGSIVPTVGGNENTLAQLGDGTIYMNVRNQVAGTPTKWVSRSTDGGATWSALERQRELISTNVQSATVYTDGKLLIAHSAQPGLIREDMTVSLSLDEGVTFPARTRLNTGFAAYPAMCRLFDGRLAIAYEVDDYDNIEFGFLSIVYPKHLV